MNEINLRGLRVLNTRPYAQGIVLSKAINLAGGQALTCPALTILPLPATWYATLPAWQAVEQALFISSNAVKYSCEVFAQKQLKWPAHIEVIAIGKSTALALQHQLIPVHTMPIIHDSEHLLLLDSLQHTQNKTILLFKGQGGRPLLAETLISRGANLHEISVYQRTLPPINKEQLDALWQENAVDIILFTSQEAMNNIFTMFGKHAHSWLMKTPCLVISERLAQIASSLGMQNIIRCNTNTILAALHTFNKGLLHGN